MITFKSVIPEGGGELTSFIWIKLIGQIEVFFKHNLLLTVSI